MQGTSSEWFLSANLNPVAPSVQKGTRTEKGGSIGDGAIAPPSECVLDGQPSIRSECCAVRLGFSSALRSWGLPCVLGFGSTSTQPCACPGHYTPHCQWPVEHMLNAMDLCDRHNAPRSGRPCSGAGGIRSRGMCIQWDTIGAGVDVDTQHAGCMPNDRLRP